MLQLRPSTAKCIRKYKKKKREGEVPSKKEQLLLTRATKEGFTQKASRRASLGLESLFCLLACVSWVSHGLSPSLGFFPVRKVSNSQPVLRLSYPSSQRPVHQAFFHPHSHPEGVGGDFTYRNEDSGDLPASSCLNSHNVEGQIQR